MFPCSSTVSCYPCLPSTALDIFTPVLWNTLAPNRFRRYFNSRQWLQRDVFPRMQTPMPKGLQSAQSRHCIMAWHEYHMIADPVQKRFFCLFFFFFAYGFSLSTWKLSLYAFHQNSFWGWDFLAAWGFDEQKFALNQLQKRKNCPLLLPVKPSKEKLKKTSSSTTIKHHIWNIMEINLMGSPFCWFPVVEHCWNTHLQIRLWSLTGKKNCDLSLPLISTQLAEVATPYQCNLIGSSQGNHHTDLNANAPLSAQAWFSVSWKGLKIWDTVEILSTTLQ